jgi:hypothetical protein
MPVNRRTFLSQAAALSSNAWLIPSSFSNLAQPSFQVPTNFTLKLLATNWGFSGSFDAFCAQAKEAGYDGKYGCHKKKLKESYSLQPWINMN